MIGLPAGTRIWIAAGVTDLRRGFTGLSGMVQTKASSGNAKAASTSRETHGRLDQVPRESGAGACDRRVYPWAARIRLSHCRLLSRRRFAVCCSVPNGFVPASRRQVFGRQPTLFQMEKLEEPAELKIERPY